MPGQPICRRSCRSSAPVASSATRFSVFCWFRCFLLVFCFFWLVFCFLLVLPPVVICRLFRVIRNWGGHPLTYHLEGGFESGEIMGSAQS